jgi:hypothetical protein
LFCLATLRRAYALALDLIHSPTPASQGEHFVGLMQRSLSLIFWSMFHMECLRFMVDRRVSPATEGMLREILTGFRLCVPAYASAREALDVQSAADGGLDLPGISWDSEDRSLAEESTAEREETLGGW